MSELAFCNLFMRYSFYVALHQNAYAKKFTRIEEVQRDNSFFRLSTILPYTSCSDYLYYLMLHILVIQFNYQVTIQESYLLCDYFNI